MKDKNLREILRRTDNGLLVQWLLDYSKKNPGFEKLLRERFDPKKIQKEFARDYPKIIRSAFHKSSLKSYSRYNQWDDYGFDAVAVRAELEKVLDDADYFLKNNNLKMVVEICKNMIEIIPEEWDEQFDYDGDVQVMYDDAIDKLELILKERLLSKNEESELFDWYQNESKDLEKHEYVGLNTNLDVVQQYFLSSEEMTEQNLRLLDEKTQKANDNYYKENYVVEKIEILKEISQPGEMQKTIEQYLNFPIVRRIKLDDLIQKKEYDSAVDLILGGITEAEKKGHSGTISDWKDELLKIAQIQNDKKKILQLAEEQLYKGRVQRKYYTILKSQTPAEDWEVTLTRILDKMKSGSGLFGFNELRADILIEHQKWDELYTQCVKGGINYLADYEKYLRPQFDKEIFDIYLKFIEKQATWADQKAYENVAQFLKRLKTFSDGKQKVKELIAEYRTEYKRRKNMMKELDKV